MKYKALIEGQEAFQIEIGEAISINNEQVSYDAVELPNGSFNVIVDNQSVNAEVISIDRNNKTASIKIDGKLFVVAVEDEFDRLLESMGMDKSATNMVSEVKSPMPGLVLDIKVNVGDSVTKDQPLMVLEAMKMENVIASPGDAVIASIEVATQDKVDKNQILVKFQ